MYTARFHCRIFLALSCSVVALLGLHGSTLSQSEWLDKAFKKPPASSRLPSRGAEKTREQRWCEQSYQTFAAALTNNDFRLWHCTPQGWPIFAGLSACVAFHPTYGFAIWMNREPETLETISLHRLIPKRTQIENETYATVRLVVDKVALDTAATEIYHEAAPLPAYKAIVYAPVNAWREISEGNELWIAISDGKDTDVWQFNLQGSRFAIDSTRACLSGT